MDWVHAAALAALQCTRRERWRWMAGSGVGDELWAVHVRPDSGARRAPGPAVAPRLAEELRDALGADLSPGELAAFLITKGTDAALRAVRLPTSDSRRHQITRLRRAVDRRTPRPCDFPNTWRKHYCR